MIQVYYGDGKGKTTAAIGAAVRARGAGWRVLVVQFLKNGDSSEVAMLRRMGVEYTCSPVPYTLFSSPEEEARERLKSAYATLLTHAKQQATACHMIVLDEVLDTLDMGLIDGGALLTLLDETSCEWVLTGHTLPAAIESAADYVTHMIAEQHPYAHGTSARRGVEY